MRQILVPLMLMLLIAPVVAQDTESPRESFQGFIDAVLAEEATEAERTAAFDRYFAFATWLSNKQEADGKTYSEAEAAEFKQGWYDLFRSAEFRQRYVDSGVVIENSKINGTDAELTITLGDQQFHVLMTQSSDGTWWRWHDIPIIDKPKDPEARIAEIEQALKDLRAERERLGRIEEALLEEISRLRSELAEEGAGESPYATPRSVVETAWKAIEGNDANGLLDCHTSRRVSDADAESVKSKVQSVANRLMSWNVLDSTIDTADPSQAVVRVRIKLQRTGEPDDRTLNVRVIRVGQNWKIDEEP